MTTDNQSPEAGGNEQSNVVHEFAERLEGFAAKAELLMSADEVAAALLSAAVNQALKHNPAHEVAALLQAAAEELLGDVECRSLN